MWMPSFVEQEEFAWVVVLWPIEGLLKWDFYTLISITSLDKEEKPIFVLACTMDRIIFHGRVSTICIKIPRLVLNNTLMFGLPWSLLETKHIFSGSSAFK